MNTVRSFDYGGAETPKVSGKKPPTGRQNFLRVTSSPSMASPPVAPIATNEVSRRGAPESASTNDSPLSYQHQQPAQIKIVHIYASEQKRVLRVTSPSTQSFGTRYQQSQQPAPKPAICAHPTGQNEYAPGMTYSEEKDDVEKRIRIYEWAKGIIQEATAEARERQRLEFADEEFQLKLGVWRAYLRLRKKLGDKPDIEDVEESNEGLYWNYGHWREVWKGGLKGIRNMKPRQRGIWQRVLL